MEIRAALPADRDGVIALWEACGLTRPWNDPVADVDRALGGPASTLLVGEEPAMGTGIVATAMVGEDGHRGWVYYLAVRPELQGGGHGRRMMAACESWLRARGVPKIQLMVRDANEPVLGFYAALGYEPQAVRVLGRWLADGAGPAPAAAATPATPGAASTDAPSPAIGPAFAGWPVLNRALRDAVIGLTPEQLAQRPTPDHWPLWAIVGHLACQRVFWLCDFAGEPRSAETPFPNAAWSCPGDEDLVNVLDGPALAAALDATFAIVEGALARWTMADLAEVIRRDWGDEPWIKSRGEVIARVLAHDTSHAAEASLALGLLGLPALDIWP